MLPSDLRERVKKYAPTAVWRMPNIYTLMGHLSMAHSRYRDTGDHSYWRGIEKVGADIMKWIEEDPKRYDCYCRICDQKNNQEANDPFFGRS